MEWMDRINKLSRFVDERKLQPGWDLIYSGKVDASFYYTKPLSFFQKRANAPENFAVIVTVEIDDDGVITEHFPNPR